METLVLVPPGHAIVTTVAWAPPLYASSCARCSGTSSVSVSLVGPAPSKLTLREVNRCQGADRYQPAAPQSMTPFGYSPVSGWLSSLRSSKVTVWGAPPDI